MNSLRLFPLAAFLLACTPAKPTGRLGMAEDSSHIATARDSAFAARGDTLSAPVELAPFQEGKPGGTELGMGEDSASHRADTLVARQGVPLKLPVEPKR